MFSFCDSKLYYYALTLEGGFPTFTRILERETARLGQGYYSVSNNEGRSHVLTVQWDRSDAVVLLRVMHLPQVSSDLSVFETWEQKAVCGPH